MGQSQRVRAADELAVYRLVAECRELGADADQWQRHLIEGLQHLTGGLLVAVGPTPGPPETWNFAKFVEGVVEGGWPSDAARNRFHEWASQPELIYQHPATAAFFARTESLLACTRRELVSDRDWNRSVFVNEELRAHGVDEGLLARVATLEMVYLLTVVRERGAAPFPPRVGRVVERLMTELAPHLGRSLWLTTQPHISTLSPRRRAALECLLDGDSEKQAALRLGVQVSTIHEHVQGLYRHFGVESRAELLAVFLRRHRPTYGLPLAPTD